MSRRLPGVAVVLVALVTAAAVVVLVIGPGGAGAAGARPDLDLPFACGDSWRLDSWGHAPALDMVREPDQHGTEGAGVLAPAAGTVVQSFRHDNAGNMVQIDHGGGWFTTYIHLQSRSVSKGDKVARGDPIGKVGHTGPTSNGHPHLHFELAYDANGDGGATWGTADSERVTPVFDGVTYGTANNKTWRRVTSTNCDEPPPTTAPPTTAAPTTTAPTAPTTGPGATTLPPTLPIEPAEGTAACAQGGHPLVADGEIAVMLQPHLGGKLSTVVDAYRISCARRIVETVADRGMDPEAAVAALTASIVDAGLQNHDAETSETSLGLFQQRSFWGSAGDRLDPTWATMAFLDKLVRKYPADAWTDEPVAAIVQTVQVSAHPERYGAEVYDAILLVEALWI